MAVSWAEDFRDFEPRHRALELFVPTKEWLSLVPLQSHRCYYSYLGWQPLRCWQWPLLMVMLIFFQTTLSVDPSTGLIIRAIPSADGHTVWVWATLDSGVDTPVSGFLCDSVSGSCQAMTCAAGSCSGNLNHLPIGTTIEGQMTLTIVLSSTEIWESGPLPFTRAFVPAQELVSIASPDNLLQLTLFPDSLPADTYILILAASTLPGALPSAHRLIGRLYSVRASGAIVQSDRPMSLRLGYDALWLDDATPHNLSIFEWDAFRHIWEEEGGAIFTNQNHLSISVQRFTAYALLEVPAWRDTFADSSGLSVVNGTSPTPEGGLILTGGILSGSAISIPITPTTVIANWDRVVFTPTLSAATNLMVDVLGADGTVIHANATGGDSLENVDPEAHPHLRLRARLFATRPGESLVLEEWRVTWIPAPIHRIYLPMIIR